jgi:excisionase family DNA binding protein
MPLPSTPTSDDRPDETPDYRALGLSKAMYTVAGAIDVLSIGRTRLYKLIADRELNPIRFGRRTLFFAKDLADFLMRLQRLEAHGATEPGSPARRRQPNKGKTARLRVTSYKAAAASHTKPGAPQHP